MKQSTLHTLITAKAIFNESVPLINSGNTYSCSAGLILLQDSIELVFLALLGEKGVDEEKSLEKKSFDELIGELKKTGIAVPKSGTLKALNKQRVITKHYGQLAQPDTVLNYYQAAKKMIDSCLTEVIGKTLDEVLLTDLLPECEAKDYLIKSSKLKDEGKYLECLIEIRKAFYVEYEHDYAVHRWANTKPGETGIMFFLGKGGYKAPSYTKNSQWLAENVRTPTDYVQIDYQKIRYDALEWGVPTSSVENVRRLTPQVFRADKDSEWRIAYDLMLSANEASEANCGYCLETAIGILVKKKEHESTRRYPQRVNYHEAPPIYIGHNLFKQARTDSEVVHAVQDGFEYTMDKSVSGFLDGEEFYYVSAQRPADEENKFGSDFVSGYLLKVEEDG